MCLTYARKHSEQLSRCWTPAQRCMVNRLSGCCVNARMRHHNANYYLVSVGLCLACRATYMPRSTRRQKAHLGRSTAVQALGAASKASPGLPVLVLEDDVQVASFFALRVSRLISAIEVRSGGAGQGGLRLAMSCIARNWQVPHGVNSAPWPGSVRQVLSACK